jgi:hypothetical protein
LQGRKPSGSKTNCATTRFNQRDSAHRWRGGILLLSQLVVVSDLEQVLSKLVGLGFADYGCVSVLSLLPERVGVCVAFPALICEYYEGAASVSAAYFEPD